MNLWYAYIHINGTLHVKRYFDAGDITEAVSSYFVQKVFDPLPAMDREGAIRLFNEMRKMGKGGVRVR